MFNICTCNYNESCLQHKKNQGCGNPTIFQQTSNEPKKALIFLNTSSPPLKLERTLALATTMKTVVSNSKIRCDILLNKA